MGYCKSYKRQAININILLCSPPECHQPKMTTKDNGNSKVLRKATF